METERLRAVLRGHYRGFVMEVGHGQYTGDCACAGDGATDWQGTLDEVAAQWAEHVLAQLAAAAEPTGEGAEP